MTGDRDLDVCGNALALLRERAPRVHCITNTVVQNFTANGLLAIGAIPSMTINPEEVADFVAGADALLINLGTIDGDRRTAIPLALAAAREHGIPVVLDPVFVDRSAGRANFARGLVAKADIVRANQGEWASLVGGPGETDDLAGHIARTLVGARRAAVISGATDRVVDPARSVTVGGGHGLMARVTGVGCMQSAVMAALAAVAATPFHAALAGCLMFAVCGDRAAAEAKGPGTFAAALLDALYAMSPAVLKNDAMQMLEKHP